MILVVCFFLIIIAALNVLFLHLTSKPYPGSERIIREAAAKELGKDPNELNDADYEQITSLSFQLKGSYNAFDIKSLEKFKNLKGLSIRSYMSPRADVPAWKKILAKIHVLSLDSKVTIDLEPLEKIKNLNSLSLERVHIKDLSPLNNHTNLQTLSLMYSSISNLKTIPKLDNLEMLDLTKTNVVDIRLLKKLANLKRLSLGQTSVSNLDSLCDLVNLRDLNLSQTPIGNDDLYTLCKLPNLAVLYMRATWISSLEPLKGCQKLHELYIVDCPYIKNEQIKELKKTLPRIIIYQIIPL